jgi:FkbM family methyltransferase
MFCDHLFGIPPPFKFTMKRFLQNVANSLGYEVRRVRAASEDDSFSFARELIGRPKPVVFDVGAHDGKTAQRLRSLFPSAIIHCFEPFPDSYRLLQQAVGGDSMTHVHRLGLCDRTGTAPLNCNTSAATNSLLATDARAAATWGDGLVTTSGSVGVTVTTLDSFCSGAQIDEIDLLKLDTQGSEYAVLQGAVALLTRHGIGVLILEMITAPTYAGQRSPGEYFKMLEAYGYGLSGVFSPMYRCGMLAQCDMAFTPRG